MKSLPQHIFETLHINKNTKTQTYNYHPKTKDELEELIRKLLKERGENTDLNDIDTSEITDMAGVFYNSVFNGDISEWDVSKVEDMTDMFKFSLLETHLPEWYQTL